MKHTPGPWMISRDPREDMEWNNAIACETAPNLEICSMFHTMSNGDNNAEGEANARLIAAAPDLYRELAHLVRLMTPLEKDGGLNIAGLATLNGARAARAALAKVQP